MKNVLIYTRNSVRGGCVRSTKEWMRHDSLFRKNGIHIIYATYEGNPAIDFDVEKIDYAYLPIEDYKLPLFDDTRRKNLIYRIIFIISKILNYMKRPYIFYNNQKTMIRFMKKKKIHAVVANSGGYVKSTCTQMLRAARTANINTRILVLRSYPIERKGSQLLSGRLFDWFIKRNASDIIAVSRFTAQRTQRITNDFPDIRVIYNGLDKPLKNEDITIKKEKLLGRQKADKKKIIGMIGNFEFGKGQIYFIKMIERLINEGKDNIVGVLIGGKDYDKAYYQYCVDYIHDHNLEQNIIIRDDITTDAGKYAECFHISLIPSINIESFGLVILESMMYGVPVIGFRTGGIPEVIEDGKSGIVVEKKDISAMAEGVCRLLNDDVYEEYSRNAFIRWKKFFTGEQMCHNYSNYLKEKIMGS